MFYFTRTLSFSKKFNTWPSENKKTLALVVYYVNLVISFVRFVCNDLNGLLTCIQLKSIKLSALVADSFLYSCTHPPYLKVQHEYNSYV